VKRCALPKCRISPLALQSATATVGPRQATGHVYAREAYSTYARGLEAIAEGRQPVELTVERLTRRIDLPLLWSAQEQALGMK
jgi:hypothetical protein